MAAADRTGQEEKLTALYGRLSDDDGLDVESNSIANQRAILLDYAVRHGYRNPRYFYDDGVSGTTFDRPGFRAMEALVERGRVSAVIVKDLSRFGRNYLEVGRYLEVVYPTRGVKFIAIQENVDTATGNGTEMMPFHNIFNEWYAAQTSRKIKAVWAMKSARGERVGQAIPYGYMKDPNDPKKWVIDEMPAWRISPAGVVREIYAMCLDGCGPSQIARQMAKERLLCPTAYKQSVGRRCCHLPPEDPYFWDVKTVTSILENRKYTGCTVNFKRTNVSYKVHKEIRRPESEWQIIPNTQEPIIDEDMWLRVQELRKHKRRYTATGRTSLFSGLAYCHDCGAKLHFCASRNLRRDLEWFRCANYKSGRGKCTVHFIRDVVLEQTVLDAVRALAAFVEQHEEEFLFMQTQKRAAQREKSIQDAQRELEQSRQRSAEIDRIIPRLYEDYLAGRFTADRFAKMTASYEDEQEKLRSAITGCERILDQADDDALNLRMLTRGLRDFAGAQTLTPSIVNTLVERIEVYNRVKIDGHFNTRVDIYFTGIGMFETPDEEELKQIRAACKKDGRTN